MRKKSYFFFIVAILSANHCQANNIESQAKTVAVLQQAGQLIGNEQRRSQQLLTDYRQYSNRQKAATPAISVVKQSPTAALSSTSFYVQKIIFNPSAIFSAAELAEIARPYEKRQLNLQEVELLLAKINELYRQKGFITAKAILPPQKIVAEQLHIELIEGRYGAFKVVDATRQARPQYILAHLPLRTGELVRLDRLEKALLYFNRTNGMQLTVRLVPGQSLGQTDCLIFVQAPPSTTYVLASDNNGTSSSGRDRLSLMFADNDLWGGSENVFAATTRSKGSTSNVFNYSQPISKRGLRLGLSYSKNGVDVLFGELASLDIQGHSQDYGLTLTQPLLVTRHWKTDAYLEMHKKKSSTDFFGNELLAARASTYTYGLNFLHNSFRRVTAFSLSQTALTASQKYGYQQKRFTRWNVSVQQQQLFAKQQIFSWSLQGQYTTQCQLPSTEQFTLGGISTVKGFGEGTTFGDCGYYLGMEYSFLCAPQRNGRILLDFDHGAAWQKYNAGNIYSSLTSASVGYAQQLGKELSLKLYYSFPLHHSGNLKPLLVPFHFSLQYVF